MIDITWTISQYNQIWIATSSGSYVTRNFFICFEKKHENSRFNEVCLGVHKNLVWNDMGFVKDVCYPWGQFCKYTLTETNKLT